MSVLGAQYPEAVTSCLRHKLYSDTIIEEFVRLAGSDGVLLLGEQFDCGDFQLGRLSVGHVVRAHKQVPLEIVSAMWTTFMIAGPIGVLSPIPLPKLSAHVAPARNFDVLPASVLVLIPKRNGIPYERSELPVLKADEVIAPAALKYIPRRFGRVRFLRQLTAQRREVIQHFHNGWCGRHRFQPEEWVPMQIPANPKQNHPVPLLGTTVILSAQGEIGRLVVIAITGPVYRDNAVTGSRGLHPRRLPDRPTSALGRVVMNEVVPVLRYMGRHGRRRLVCYLNPEPVIEVPVPPPYGVGNVLVIRKQVSWKRV